MCYRYKEKLLIKSILSRTGADSPTESINIKQVTLIISCQHEYNPIF